MALPFSYLPKVSLSIIIFTTCSNVVCLSPSIAPQRQWGLLCKLPDHQDIVVEEERKWRLRLQRMWFIPKTAFGKSDTVMYMCMQTDAVVAPTLYYTRHIRLYKTHL